MQLLIIKHSVTERTDKKNTAILVNAVVKERQKEPQYCCRGRIFSIQRCTVGPKSWLYVTVWMLKQNLHTFGKLHAYQSPKSANLWFLGWSGGAFLWKFCAFLAERHSYTLMSLWGNWDTIHTRFFGTVFTGQTQKSQQSLLTVEREKNVQQDTREEHVYPLMDA